MWEPGQDSELDKPVLDNFHHPFFFIRFHDEFDLPSFKDWDKFRQTTPTIRPPTTIRPERQYCWQGLAHSRKQLIKAAHK